MTATADATARHAAMNKLLLAVARGGKKPDYIKLIFGGDKNGKK